MQPFEIKQGKFLLNGENFPLYSGAIHYFRTVEQDWRDRLAKLKACGFNTVETYVCWNLHEPQPGQFDFSGMLDIAKFLRIAQELGLWAIVRPGPYICSEWDLGGLPPWLLKDPAMRLRVAYPPYLERVKIFFENFLPQIAPMQITRGGNVIMVQVENEYGSYGNDHEYLEFCRKCILDGGIDVPLFTSDGGWESALTGGKMEGILATANFGSRAKQNFDCLRKYEPEGPWVCMEFWNGWFDHWGTDHHARDSGEVVEALNEILDDNGYVNFYMFHGGTNFGFTAGANFHDKYSPTVTSYDDDAPLNEYGGYTPKYHAIRNVLLERQGIDPATLPLPEQAPLQHVGNVELTEQALLFEQLDNIATHHKSVQPESMEYYGQNWGLILYRSTLKAPQSNDLNIFVDGLADRASVFVDGKFYDRLWRNDGEGMGAGVDDALVNGGQVDVLVEAMGRVNYGPQLHDRKGARQIRANGQLMSHFDVYTMELDNVKAITFTSAQDLTEPNAPVFLRGKFVAKAQDCFLHLEGLNKGIAWVNGKNLGRYWKIGPQKSLYIPGAWLNDGENEVIILELEGGKARSVEIKDIHEIGERKS